MALQSKKKNHIEVVDVEIAQENFRRIEQYDKVKLPMGTADRIFGLYLDNNIYRLA